MSSLPSDDDGHTRRATDPKPTVASKIPRSDRRSSALVGTSVSPRIRTVSPLKRHSALDIVGSKLPRKSPVPSQSPSLRSNRTRSSLVLQQSSLNSSNARTSPVVAMPANSDTTKPVLISSLEKPLPSPPFAQVIDPNSTPEAQRTLVDAESGSLSNTKWPILCPEDVLHHTNNFKTDSNKDLTNQQQQQQPQRSVSDGAVTRRFSNPYFVNRNFKSTAAASILEAQSFEEKNIPKRPQSQQMSFGPTLGSRNPYGGSFHAISTGTDMAIESPLSRKIGPPFAVTIPPRYGSKRVSMPLSTLARPFPSSSPLSLELRSVDLQETGSPVVENRQSLEGGAKIPSQVVTSLPQTPISAVAHASSKNISGSGLDVDSVAGQEVELRLSSGIRIKYLKGYSLVTSPVLTIYPDAELMLCGPTDQVSPSTFSTKSNSLPSEFPRETSIRALDDEFYQELNLGKPRTVTQSSIQTSVDVDKSTTTPVKIDPIRSMQPMRRTNLEDSVFNSSPPTASPVKSIRRRVNTLNMFAGQPEGAGQAIFEAYGSDIPSTYPDKIETDFDSIIEEKTSQTFGTVPGDPKTVAIHQSGPFNLSFALKDPNSKNESECETSPYLSSDEPLDGRNTIFMSGMSGLSLHPAFRTSPSQDRARTRGPSKLRATGSAIPMCGEKFSTRTTPLSTSQNSSRQPGLVTFASPAARKTQNAVENKVKLKRSLRDIFLGRDNKQSDKLQPNLKHKRSFMTETRSTLAKRLRETKSLSKIQLPKIEESNSSQGLTRQPSLPTIKLDADVASRDANRQAALSSLEAASYSPAQDVAARPQFNTEKVVNNIINSVLTMPSEAPDRLGGLEIAEAVLHSVECYKKAQLSAEKASKHARDAELHAKQATIEIDRLHELCKHRFGTDTLESIERMIKSTSLVGKVVEKDEDDLKDA